MMNRDNVYTPFSALFVFGSNMGSKSFVGMELLRAIRAKPIPESIKYSSVEQVKIVYHV